MSQQHLRPQRVQPASLSQPRSKKQSFDLMRGVLFGLIIIVMAVAALFSVFAGLLIWLIASLSHDRREAWRWIAVLSLIGSVVYTAWLLQASPLPALWLAIRFDFGRHLWHAILAPVVQTWTINVLLAPLVALLLAYIYPRSTRPAGHQTIKEMSLNEYEQAARQQRATITQAVTLFEHMAAPQQQRELIAFPPSLVQIAPRLEVLGSYEGGELSAWVYGGQLCLTAELLRLHGVIIGEPSFGKTTTLIRLLAIARSCGRKVIYLDLKGSKTTAAHFLAAMKILDTPSVRMYPREALDGWRGTPQALFNRLMEQIDPKTHPFYRSGVGGTVVSLAVKAPPGPPTNSYEFLERLDVKWLKRAYASDIQAQRDIHAVAEHLNGIALVFGGFFRGIAGALDGSWSFEDTDAAYIGVDGTANKEEAATLGRYLLEDAANFATSRKDPSDKVTFIIDEFGVLRSTNATDLYERVRESGMSIYAAAQSYEALGIEKNNLLAAAAIKILHRTGAPEQIVKYAGERELPQFSRYMGGGGGSEAQLLPAMNRPAESGNERPDVIMRTQKEYAITIEEVQQLGLGEVAVLYGGEGAFAKITPLAIPESLEQAARRFLEASPSFTPLPPPKKQRPAEREPTNAERSRPQRPGPAAEKEQTPRRPGPGEEAGERSRPQRPGPGAEAEAGKGSRPRPRRQGAAEEQEANGSQRPPRARKQAAEAQTPDSAKQATITPPNSQDGATASDDFYS